MPNQDRPDIVGQVKPPDANEHANDPMRFASTVARELDTPIKVNQRGAPSFITKRKAIAIQLVKRALNGDARAAAILQRYMRSFESEEVVKPYKCVFG